MNRVRLHWSALLIILIASSLVAVGGAAARDTSAVKAIVEPGSTTLLVSGQQVEVQTTSKIIVTLSLQNGQIQGDVELAPGSDPAQVRITVIGNPDQVIFDGRVDQKQLFLRVIPGETGQGEM
jgi:hypothetical protein